MNDQIFRTNMLTKFFYSFLDISDAPVIIGVKQVPIDNLLENKTYVFFSHTIKAQEDNMAMLDACLDRNIR